MNTFTYTVTATPTPTGSTKTKSQSLTGTTDVTFSLSGLNTGYEAAAGGGKKLNKVVVDFDDGQELVLTRPLGGTTIASLSSETFKHVIQTDFTDQAKRHVYFTLYRDDQEVDVIDLKLTMFKPPITTYEDINLLKTDYFNNDVDNEKLLLTFINKNPEVLGLSLLDINVPGKAGYDPSLTTSQSTSTNSFNVGFTTEYVHTYAHDSNTGSAIQVSLGDTINPNTGLPKDNGKISFKYRTRAPEPIQAGGIGAISLPNNPELFYVPLTANSSFIHLSGFLTWNCSDIMKDIDLTTKTITIPLIDITGTKTSLTDYYFTNVNTGIGTSMTGFASGGYFYLDLYDVTGCDTITTTTSTITAFVNY